ncbi:MAG: FG-GAP-like repeat-containing protein [Acidobacteriota bacterium]
MTAPVLLQSNDATKPNLSVREDAYRANNLGVALLEQFKHKEASEEFRRALKINPQLYAARINLAIALYNVPDVEGALTEIKAAAEVAPDAPQVQFMFGLIARNQSRPEDAIAAFQKVLKADPLDVASNINLAQLYMQQRKFDDAIKLLREALRIEPYNITATYNLAIALTRSGVREEGQPMMARFLALRDGGYGTSLGQNYLEQGQYAEAMVSTGAEPELIDTTIPDVTFNEATGSFFSAGVEKKTGANKFFGQRFNSAAELSDAAKRELIAALGGSLTPIDFDGDGDLDLFEVTPSAQKLYRNDKGKFVDVSKDSGLALSNPQTIAIGAVAGDYDNDGRADLFVLRLGGNALYHNDGNSKFSDATPTAKIPAFNPLAISAALVDVDHDGDLDIFIAGFADLNKPTKSTGALTFPDDFAAAPNQLLRNNGNGTFTDNSEAAKLATGAGHAVAVVPTDYNNRRDVDLLLVNYDAPPTLYSNQRDGSFKDVTSEVGLTMKGRFTCVAAGDINKDSFTDFYFGEASGAGFFALSNRRGGFTMTAASAGIEGASAAQFVDYDNDGLLDLIAIAGGKLRVWRNLGNNWQNVTDRAVAKNFAMSVPTSDSPHRFAAADLDSDGDTDLLLHITPEQIKVARNDGGNRNRSLRINLAGKISNRSGVGAKVEMRAGSLQQKIETASAVPAAQPADVLFGLGKRAAADTVRVLWTSGILQSETETPRAANINAQTMSITEVDRKPSSCPYLYTWNGERFEFITDFMGGGEMGYWEAPEVYNHPDPVEYTRIRDEQLKARNGIFELRVTNELEEVLFVDNLKLMAIAHPSNIEVFPNEGMTSPPREFKLFTTRNAQPPVSAVDDKGQDVLARIAKMDRSYPDNFTLHRIRGYAETHSLTLNLGEASSKKTLLLLTGWTDYAFSSDNVAAHQAGLTMQPPGLQVKDKDGNWQTVMEVGIPVGRPQTIVLDLSGKFLTASREVRIVTNMRIYWDQILVDRAGVLAQPRIEWLKALTAKLSWRGFSAEVTPDGREPYTYDYQRVTLTSPWKTFAGRYTREGDVRTLLARTDDLFVIARPGDEIALAFDAKKLAPLPKGWKRAFLLYSDGYSKEMDIHSASPDAVTPLPFHAMKKYPYEDMQTYPQTAVHRDYLKRFNTRVVGSPLPRIEAPLAAKFLESGSR